MLLNNVAQYIATVLWMSTFLPNVIAENQRLIVYKDPISQLGVERLMTYDEILRELVARDLGFIDITREVAISANKEIMRQIEISTFGAEGGGDIPGIAVPIKACIPPPSMVIPDVVPKVLQQQKAINSLKMRVNSTRITSRLTKFSGFTNRFYNSSFGLQSSNWVFDQLNALPKVVPNSFTMTVEKYIHKDLTLKQNSIIVKLTPTTPLFTDLVVIGSHLDSINYSDFKENGVSPGADDDNGVITNLEVLEVLTSSNSTDFVLTRPVEFHFYTAEEVGLLGSADIASAYVKNGIIVSAMMQIDMTGYTGYLKKGKQPIIAVDKGGDSHTNAFTILVGKTYTDAVMQYTDCGYACSDHGSWSRNNYPTTFPFESPFVNHNPNIHGAGDTMKFVDIQHMVRFVHLTIGWVLEIATTKSPSGFIKRPSKWFPAADELCFAPDKQVGCSRDAIFGGRTQDIIFCHSSLTWQPKETCPSGSTCTPCGDLDGANAVCVDTATGKVVPGKRVQLGIDNISFGWHGSRKN